MHCAATRSLHEATLAEARVTEPPRIKEWRDRADEYRQFAEEADTDDGRASYLAVARNCEEIAARLDRLVKNGREP